MTELIETEFPPQSARAIGKRLRYLRDALGVSSHEMAHKCSIEEKTFSAYITGQNLLKPDVAIRIINAYPGERIDFNWFYRGDLGGLSHSLALKINSLNISDSLAKIA